MSLVFTYVVPVLLVLIIFRFIQLKKSIKNRDYDYSYYEEGPYGPRKREPKTLWGKIKKALGFKQYICLGFFVSVSQLGCDQKPPAQQLGDYQTGVFCINEGVFGQTSGTITHYDPSSKKVTQKIFNQANNRDLGNVVQSLHFTSTNGYIIVNNSNKIEVVNPNTFEEKAQITGLAQPRYMVSKGNVGYVSQWGLDGLSGSIAVLDLTTNSIQQTISVGKGPEHLLWKGNQLYVPLVGGYDTENKVLVINTISNTITDTIVVADKPNRCLVDNGNNIWILCGGKTVYTTYPNIDVNTSTASGIFKLTNDTISYQKDFNKGEPAGNFTFNPTDNVFYYTRTNTVWQFNPNSLQEQALITGQFYGLDFDATSNYIYTASNAATDPATAKYYATNGTPIDSFQVGVFANGFVFR